MQYNLPHVRQSARNLLPKLLATSLLFQDLTLPNLDGATIGGSEPASSPALREEIQSLVMPNYSNLTSVYQAANHKLLLDSARTRPEIVAIASAMLFARETLKAASNNSVTERTQIQNDLKNYLDSLRQVRHAVQTGGRLDPAWLTSVKGYGEVAARLSKNVGIDLAVGVALDAVPFTKTSSKIASKIGGSLLSQIASQITDSGVKFGPATADQSAAIRFLADMHVDNLSNSEQVNALFSKVAQVAIEDPNFAKELRVAGVNISDSPDRLKEALVGLADYAPLAHAVIDELDGSPTTTATAQSTKSSAVKEGTSKVAPSPKQKEELGKLGFELIQRLMQKGAERTKAATELVKSTITEEKSAQLTKEQQLAEDQLRREIFLKDLAYYSQETKAGIFIASQLIGLKDPKAARAVSIIGNASVEVTSHLASMVVGRLVTFSNVAGIASGLMSFNSLFSPDVGAARHRQVMQALADIHRQVLAVRRDIADFREDTFKDFLEVKVGINDLKKAVGELHSSLLAGIRININSFNVISDQIKTTEEVVNQIRLDQIRFEKNEFTSDAEKIIGDARRVRELWEKRGIPTQPSQIEEALFQLLWHLRDETDKFNINGNYLSLSDLRDPLRYNGIIRGRSFAELVALLPATLNSLDQGQKYEAAVRSSWNLQENPEYEAVSALIDQLPKKVLGGSRTAVFRTLNQRHTLLKLGSGWTNHLVSAFPQNNHLSNSAFATVRSSLETNDLRNTTETLWSTTAYLDTLTQYSSVLASATSRLRPPSFAEHLDVIDGALQHQAQVFEAISSPKFLSAVVNQYQASLARLERSVLYFVATSAPPWSITSTNNRTYEGSYYKGALLSSSTLHPAVSANIRSDLQRDYEFQVKIPELTPDIAVALATWASLRPKFSIWDGSVADRSKCQFTLTLDLEGTGNEKFALRQIYSQKWNWSMTNVLDYSKWSAFPWNLSLSFSREYIDSVIQSPNGQATVAQGQSVQANTDYMIERAHIFWTGDFDRAYNPVRKSYDDAIAYLDSKPASATRDRMLNVAKERKNFMFANPYRGPGLSEFFFAEVKSSPNGDPNFAYDAKANTEIQEVNKRYCLTREQEIMTSLIKTAKTPGTAIYQALESVNAASFMLEMLRKSVYPALNEEPYYSPQILAGIEEAAHASEPINMLFGQTAKYRASASETVKKADTISPLPLVNVVEFLKVRAQLARQIFDAELDFTRR